MFMVLTQRFMALNFLQILQPSRTYSSTRFILSKIFVIICLIKGGSSSRNLNSMDSMIRLSFLQERFPGSYDTIIHDRDHELQGHLRKAPKLTYRAWHPGNNKQILEMNKERRDFLSVRMLRNGVLSNRIE